MISAEFRAASRLAAIGVSEILRITGEAQRRKSAGQPIIILGAGEPDFDTPEHVKEAAARAMRNGRTKYTILDGSPELKLAVAEKFRRDNGIDYQTSEITCGAGAKQVIFNAFMATLDSGDEVIIPAPYWTSYFDIISVCGGVPRSVDCPAKDGFRLSAAALEATITKKTRWLLLNSPSNPSGAAYNASHLRELAQVLLRYPDIWILTDDIYEHIIYDEFNFATLAGVEPALKDRTLTVNGVSKAYAMTGWRVGYGGGPKALIQAMATVQSQSTSCPSSISQAAAIAALLGPQLTVADARRSFQCRRDLVVHALNSIPGIACQMPQGAFYTFSDCSGVIGRLTPSGMRISSDSDFCRFLLDEAEVAVVPGSCFGLTPFFRISYAAAEAELIEAMIRIKSACDRLEAA